MLLRLTHITSPKRFTALGPLMDKLGNGGKGIGWKTGTEVEQLGQLNGKTLTEGVTKGMPKIVTDIDACEVILQPQGVMGNISPWNFPIECSLVMANEMLSEQPVV